MTTTSSAFDWDLWARTNARNEERRELSKQAKMKVAQREARALTARLVEIDPAVQKVILFGSLARQDCRTEDFDVDLAVVGAQRFGALFAEAEACLLSVDLVEWELLKPQIQAHILEEGLVLYAKH